MDGSCFDALTRALARTTSRRRTLRASVATIFGGLAIAVAGRRAGAAPDGCCKCVGKTKECFDTPSKGECRTYCGVNSDDEIVFSDLHTCTKGGQGTTLQCRKKKTSSSEPDDADDADELCDEETCTETAALMASPAAVAAQDLAVRAGDGWALQTGSACLDGDACRAGGIFGAVPGDEVERLAAKVIDGYHHKTTRRTVTPETPSDVIEHRFFRFSQASEAKEFNATIRDLLPPEATDRAGESQFDALSFIFGLTGPTADIPDPAAETLFLGAQAGNMAVFSSIVTTPGGGVPDYVEREYRELIESFARLPPILDLELLVASAVSISGLAVRPEVDAAVTVLDGQSLPRDLESQGQIDFRLLTDVGTMHALRSTFVLESAVGPVNVVHEVREFADVGQAQDFVARSVERVGNYFEEALFTFVVTEFDNLGEQGTGFIFMLNQPDGSFNGGVTGYARLGTRVGVTNINVRTDAAPSPDLLTMVQDGRAFANPGVAILDRQLQIWLGTSQVSRTLSEEGVDEAFARLSPIHRDD